MREKGEPYPDMDVATVMRDTTSTEITNCHTIDSTSRIPLFTLNRAVSICGRIDSVIVGKERVTLETVRFL